MSLSTWSTQAQHEHWLWVQNPHPPTNLLLLQVNISPPCCLWRTTSTQIVHYKPSKNSNFFLFLSAVCEFHKKKKSISQKDKWWIHPHWNPLQLTTALNVFWIKKQQQHCIKVAQKPGISLDIFNPQSSKTIQQSPRIRLEAGEKAGGKMSLHYLSKTRWGQYLSKDVKIRVTSE